MVHFKVLCCALLATLASCEPPVQGYNYRRPSQTYNAPAYSAPSTAYTPPSNNYLPPSNNYLPPSNNYGPPSNNYAQSGDSFDHSSGQYDHSAHHDNGHDHGHGHESEVPKSYEFGYSVKDAQSGNDYGRHETSDGNEVRGEYRVALPDGRTQIVTYHADWRTGFHADVRYEGEARYPEPTYNNNNQGYNYNAPSDFSGSLTGLNSRPSTAYGPPGYH